MRECLQGLVPRKEQRFGESRGFEVERPNSALDHLHPPDFQCNVPLGMESGRIANEQISASSSYSDGRWTPQQSRLHGDDNGWTPNLDSSKEYLQVLTQIPEGVQRVGVLVGKGAGPVPRVNTERKSRTGVPVVAQWLTNPTRNREVAGSIPCPCSVG